MAEEPGPGSRRSRVSADARGDRGRVRAVCEHDVRRRQRDHRGDRAAGGPIRRRGWIDESEFELSYALSRLTPGTNLLAFCTAAGWTARRWRGALVALIAASVPCSVLAVVMTVFYERLQGSAAFQAALRGALVSAVAIMVATAWVFAEPHVKAAPGKALVVVPCAIALSLGVHLSPIQILLVAAAAGIAWPTRPRLEQP
jgi:chromate transporter